MAMPKGGLPTLVAPFNRFDFRDLVTIKTGNEIVFLLSAKRSARGMVDVARVVMERDRTNNLFPIWDPSKGEGEAGSRYYEPDEIVLHA